MMSLSSLLVEHRVAAPDVVEQALARQALWGSDLITNLLELTAIDEGLAQRAVERAAALEGGPAGELPACSPEARVALGPELAERFRAFPLHVRGAELVVAVAEPLSDEQTRELAAAVGSSVSQRIVLGPRLLQALSRDFGLELEQRDADALNRLVSGEAVSSDPDWSPGFSVIPRPPSEPPRPDSLWPLGAAGDAELYTAVEASILPVADPIPASRRVPRRGPITAGDVQRELSRATKRAQILSAFFDFASQFFDYSALLTMHDGVARGRDSRGPGASREVVMRIEVPIDATCALRKVQVGGTPQVITLKETGADRDLAEALQRSPRGAVFLLPVLVRGRTVLVLYGDERFKSVSLADVGEVVALAPIVGAAIERSIVAEKKSSRRIEWTVPPPPPKPLQPSIEQRTQALVSAMEEPPRDSLVPPTKSSFPVRGAPEPSPAPAGPVVSAPVIGVGRPVEAPPTPAPRVPPFKSEPVFPLSRQSTSSMPAVIPAQAEASAATPAQSWSVPSEPPTARLDQDGVEDFLRQRAAERGPRTQRSSDSAPGAGQALPDRRSEHVVADVHSSAMPPNPASSASLSVVVGGVETEELVDLACQGDEVAEAALSELGSAALPAVLRQFPGPVRPVADEIPHSTECGPLLRLVRRASTAAVPGLVELARRAGAEPGVWALVLLAEIGGSDAMQAVAEAIAHGAVPTDKFAGFSRHLLDLVRSSPEDCKRVSARLLELAGDTSQPIDVRVASILALSDLRAASVVEGLIELLGETGSINDAVVSALCVITRQDFGSDKEAWRAWSSKSLGRHRIEWLIDALGHDSAALRRAASDELKSETKEYFGYYEDLPASERASAQRRYAHWWDTVGRARFR